MEDFVDFNEKQMQWEVDNKIEGKVHPISREGHLLVYDREWNVVLLHGGLNSQVKNDFFLFDIEQQKWQEVQQSNSIDSRCYHGGCLVDGKLYVYGGQADHNKTYKDFWVFYQQQWYEVQYYQGPIGRSQFGMVHYKSNFYIFGGISLPLNKFLNDLW